MEEDKEVVDQHLLAEDISNKIKFEFMDHFLVKPLEPIKVVKEVLKDTSDKKPSVDENGVEAVDVDSSDVETKEVVSDFRKGVVLKVPTTFYLDENIKDKIKIGDVVVFNDRAGKPFDLLKDSRLIRYYDILAIER